jgi:ribonuclease BN (tRNA processing enzyme)
VKLTLVPPDCTGPGAEAQQFSTSFLVNDSVAIDAGALGFYRTPADQAKVRHVFLSHTHMDHLASLPVFLENIIDTDAPVNLYASVEVQYALRNDVFNDRLWPNFIDMIIEGSRLLTLHTIADSEPLEVDGLRITPIAVNHTVPTLGFLLEDKNAAVIIASDTGPTEKIWRVANQTPNLKAIYLEATFPNAYESLADLTLHLTPAGFLREIRKVTRPVKWYAVHVKARFRQEVTRELLAAGLPNVELAKFGVSTDF